MTTPQSTMKNYELYSIQRNGVHHFVLQINNTPCAIWEPNTDDAAAIIEAAQADPGSICYLWFRSIFNSASELSKVSVPSQGPDCELIASFVGR